jgi:hypothetical protein
MSFLSPKVPKVKDIPVPDRSSSEVQQAADEQRRAITNKSKALSWLTGGVGVPRSSQTFAAAKLLSGTS